MITFEVFITKGNENLIALIDMETVPALHERDVLIRNSNVKAGNALCDRCNGTGNEYFYHWKKCDMCKGLGYQYASRRD